MGRLQQYVASLEAIDFQHSRVLFGELTAAIHALREGGKFEDSDFKAAGIDAIIRRHTNINVTVRADKNASVVNAYVFSPTVDKNHPLLNQWRRHDKGDKLALDAIKEAGGAIEGTVDRSKSKVTGVFSKFPIRVFATLGLMRAPEERFSSAEVAAILLHELGHVFTYFEFLIMTITTNQALQAVSRGLFETEDKELKIRLIRAAEDKLNVKVDDPAALTEASRPEIIQTVLLESKIRTTRSALGSNVYDMRSWEFLADQFAARHGAARDLATALDKMMRSFGDSSVVSTPTHLILESIKLVSFIAVTFAFALLPIILLLMINPLEDEYDRHGERLMRIKNQLIEGLKDRSIEPEVRRQLLEDLDTVENLMKAVRDKSTLYQTIWKYLVPYGRQQWKQIVVQKELEDLASNELFAAAARYEDMFKGVA